MQQKGDENTQTYQVEDVTLIHHLILVTNLQGNVQQLKGRINKQIIGAKRLTRKSCDEALSQVKLCVLWGNLVSSTELIA